MMKFIGIVPVRYVSTRFSGEPLADTNGKPMIQHVYGQVKDVLDSVRVATDSIRTRSVVKIFGGRVVMTSDQHRSGTDRCYEAYQEIDEGYDVIVDTQGDKSFIHPEQVQTIKTCFTDANTQIVILVRPFRSNDDFESTLFNPNSPEVVLNSNNEAMCSSRSTISYARGKKYTEWLSSRIFYKHIGLYAYRARVLKKIAQLPQSVLELAESLEQLHWLENGYKIKVDIIEQEVIGIDTPEDMEKALTFLANH